MRMTGRTRTREEELYDFCRKCRTVKSQYPNDKRVFCEGYRDIGYLIETCKMCKAYIGNASEPPEYEATWMKKNNGVQNYRECSKCGNPVFGITPSRCPKCNALMYAENSRKYF